ncbi:unnamed protein product [Diamesa hyperborea]
MHPHRRRKKKRNGSNGIRSLEIIRSTQGFGFTIAGQKPCILSSIVQNSPADLAGLRSGDFLISVNGMNVAKFNHETVVQLIGNSHKIRMSIAENYYSDSSDEEIMQNQPRFRPKYPHNKTKLNRSQYSNEMPVEPPRYSMHHYQNSNQSHQVLYSPNAKNSADISNVSAMVHCSNVASPLSVASASMNNADNMSFRVIVGYLGTIEMPKQIATSSIFSCIRKLRQEKRNPTIVLMNILPNCLNLLNSNSVILATYPSSRLNYVSSSSSDNNSKFFGLVTSAIYADDGMPCDSLDSLATRKDIVISNSCHVFVIDTKLIDHNTHLQKADKFNISCTKDPISNTCLEFPNNSEYICNLIRSMYNIKTPIKENEAHNRPAAMRCLNLDGNLNHHRRSANDQHDLMANSPQPSNHSEITTTSSNSDSGIGFHNDYANISDRILVVDFPGLNQNRRLPIRNQNPMPYFQRQGARPFNDIQLDVAAMNPVRNIHNNIKINDDHVFLAPPSKPFKRNNNKKSLTLSGKSKSSYEENKSKGTNNESNLLYYKLSPKVFGLPRPVSVSFENLSSSSRKKLWTSKPTKKDKNEKEEDFSIWGSLQELRHSDVLQQPQHCTFLEGTYIWGQSFELLLNDPAGLHTFAEFLKKEFSGENIYFWTACERYRQISDLSERTKEALAIFDKHLAGGSLEPVNVDSHARTTARERLPAAEQDLFVQPQKQIFNLMKFDSYQRFIRSDLHKSCIDAEQKNIPLPYPGELLDPSLRITLHQHAHTTSTMTKLKKSLSNAEDRRRKSLLPWHRKTRCKSKDRGEEQKESQKNSVSSSNTLKLASNHSAADIHSSRSSLSSFDATISKIGSFDPEDSRSSLCRVILSNGATTIVQTKNNETIRELVERLLDKRGIFYQAYEAFLSNTNKPLDLDGTSKQLSGNEVHIEQRVIFKLDLPNRKVISVKSKPCKVLGEVLRPILHKYNYRLDLVKVYGKEYTTSGSDSMDMSLPVTAVDGQRLQIVCKNTEVPSNPNLTASASNPQLNTLDEITNKVFNELLQGKVDGQGMVNGVNGNIRPSEQGSIKSEDWGSEASSGIFSRMRRHRADSSAPASNRGGSKSKKSSGGSEESDVNAMKKPLIAKWKNAAGVKLQVTNRAQNDELLLEGLKRAQRSRLEDQRGTEINFELPDFLKDKEKYSNVGNKLRKTKFNESPSNSISLYNNIDICNNNDPMKMNTSPPHQRPPQPAPRLSIVSKSPTKSSPDSISSVQSKINCLENTILMNSSTSSANQVPPLPPKPKVLPIKPSNWQNTNNNNKENFFKVPQELRRVPPVTTSEGAGQTKNDVYLDQPTSSFV